jgi:transcriptional repressor NrdR
MQIESMVNEIEDETAIRSKGTREIGTKVIGDLILERLGALDKVAYIRFASVYRHFEDLDEFIREIHKLGEDEPNPQPV